MSEKPDLDWSEAETAFAERLEQIAIDEDDLSAVLTRINDTPRPEDVRVPQFHIAKCTVITAVMLLNWTTVKAACEGAIEFIHAMRRQKQRNNFKPVLSAEGQRGS